MTKLTLEIRHGIETLILSNDLVSVVILAGKGADLLEFIWKPLNINCLYRSDVPMSVYDNMNLHKKRLLNHSDFLLGGWVDALPHRGQYKDIVLEQENGGIAATLPWHYDIIKNEEEVVSVRLWVDLPTFPMHIEKVYTLYENSSRLMINETVTNMGDAPMSFTWTQHALFNLFTDSTTLEIDSNIAFKAWEHIADPGKPLEAYETKMQGTRLFPHGSDRSEFVVFNHLKLGEVALIDRDLEIAVCLKWDIEHFPYLRSLYKNNIIGLEPGNDMFSGFEYSLKHGTYKVLESKNKIETDFVLEYIDL